MTLDSPGVYEDAEELNMELIADDLESERSLLRPISSIPVEEVESLATWGGRFEETEEGVGGNADISSDEEDLENSL